MIELNSSRNLTGSRHAGRMLGAFVLVALLTTSAYAQTFEVLKEFDATGYNPRAPLIQGPDGILYGTAQSGGTAGLGVVFTIHPDGTGYNVLWNFSGGNDGGNPYAGLLLSGSTLYGTTYSGGSNSLGTVFAINTDGSGFTNLYSFTGGPDGANPCGGLVLSGGSLYGTAEEGGGHGFGSVFAVNTDGSRFTNLYSFTGGDDCGNPYAGLIISGGTLYGTTAGISPQIAYYGSVFSINTNGGGFTLLKVFEGPDGANPYGALVLFGSTLYGTTGSGNPGWGTVFAVNTNGTGFTNFYHFTGTTDGCYPYGTLVLSGGTLFGTTSGGYDYEGWVYGTIFSVNINGSDFTNIYTFTDGNDGGTLYAGLTLSGNTLFGAAYAGGNSGSGALFALTLSGPPIITNQPLSQVGLPGSTVALSVSCVGAAPLTYQWALNGVGLPGATNATLTLTNVSLVDSGSAYSVLITNVYFNLQLQADTAGSVESSTAVITVLPAIVNTQPASSISLTGAVLNGSVTVGSDETVVWFEWGTDTNYGNIADETIVPGNSGSNNISTVLNGLPGNIYHYRIDAANDSGIVYGNDVSFTVGFAPTATTLAALNSPNGSTLNATVNPRGWDTTVYFKWGAFGGLLTNLTPIMDVGAGAASLNASSFITGLTPFKEYDYQVVAANHLGTVFGALVAFYSPPFVSVPNENWDWVASSADGSVLVAVANMAGGASPAGPIIISTNSGATWAIATGAPTNGFWETVACSADGSEIIAAGGGGDTFLGPIYTSADMGLTWVSNNAPVINWQSVASSADGTRLVAAAELNQVIYTSTNSGAVWTHATNAPKVAWFSVALSADGTKLAAVANGSTNIYTSPDFGTTWITNNVPVGSPQGIQRNWSSIASSADGSKLVAAGSGFIFISTNSGAAWKLTATNIVGDLVAHPWISVASSADGSKLAAVSDATSPLGVFITSTNSGATWTTNAVPFLDWNAVALSADGARMVVTVGYPSYVGPIYTTQTTASPVLSLSAPDNVISWIIPSMNFTLQQSPDLLNWTDVTNLPVLNLTNLQNQVTLPPPDGNSFFRLIH
jgi:uncharacterized repeat protein (TIGR03803 family)